MPEPGSVTQYKPVFSLLHQQLWAAILSKIQRWNWITGNNQALDYETQNNFQRLGVWAPAFHTIIAPSSQLPPWHCGPKGRAYCIGRNASQAPKDFSIWPNRNFPYLDNGDWKITREQLETVVDICTLGQSSLDSRVLSLSWASGEVLCCRFILFYFAFTNRKDVSVSVREVSKWALLAELHIHPQSQVWDILYPSSLTRIKT